MLLGSVSVGALSTTKRGERVSVVHDAHYVVTPAAGLLSRHVPYSLRKKI